MSGLRLQGKAAIVTAERPASARPSALGLGAEGASVAVNYLDTPDQAREVGRWITGQNIRVNGGTR
jgi:hypothetical protein